MHIRTRPYFLSNYCLLNGQTLSSMRVPDNGECAEKWILGNCYRDGKLVQSGVKSNWTIHIKSLQNVMDGELIEICISGWRRWFPMFRCQNSLNCVKCMCLLNASYSLIFWWGEKKSMAFDPVILILEKKIRQMQKSYYKAVHSMVNNCEAKTDLTI